MLSWCKSMGCSILIQHDMQDLDAGGLVSLTNALSMADHESEKSAVLLKAIAAGALDLIPSFAPAQAVSLLSSFSCLRHYDEPLYRAVARHLLAQGLQKLQPRQQANLLLSLARMVRCRPFHPRFWPRNLLTCLNLLQRLGIAWGCLPRKLSKQSWSLSLCTDTEFPARAPCECCAVRAGCCSLLELDSSVHM